MFLFVTSSFGFVQGLKVEENSIEVIDQNNRNCVGCNCAETIMLFEGLYIAQSFTPTHNVLSKILFFISRTGNPPAMKIILNIRETLDGENLVSMQKETNGTDMIFDFEDINIISGNLYYMIITIDDMSTPANGYGLYKTIYDSYSRGSFFTKSDTAKWIENTQTDMLFVTYWKDYSPSIPTIQGPNTGVASDRYEYTFSTKDPEADDVEYYIEWGDGKKFEWTVPYESGKQVIKSHSWTYGDNYTIRVKARDIYGAESDWTTMKITISKNKVFINPLIRFLEKHPCMYKILQKLLVYY
jgi:phage-related protein